MKLLPQRNSKPRKRASLFSMLVCLTLLFIFAQLLFFYAHYKVSDLIDSFTQSSIARDIWHPIILFPLLKFIAIQALAYGLCVLFIWFVAVSTGELFRLSASAAYWLGLVCWAAFIITLLSLNNYYFPASFFARPFSAYEFMPAFAWLSIAILLAYINVFWSRRHRVIGGGYLLMVIGMAVHFFYAKSSLPFIPQHHSQPNIILIGLDSLRPDFTGYRGNQVIHTPHIDQFLQSATTFTQAYTPLARTFPAWVSILTAQYPKHNQARINLIDPAPILASEMLSKKLQAQGYAAFYGTDETRFTDITEDYGFDRIIGPKGGAVEFLLGGLSDFPLTNLLVNLPVGRYLFPYNYGNRAAEITYQPDTFLQLVKNGLADRPNKPLFLALHLCLSHWPFTWAENEQLDAPLSLRYQKSVETVDSQLGKLLSMLKEAGLLEHSVVVLLSDHGVTVGLPDDREVNKAHYRGDPTKMAALPVYQLGESESRLSLSTSYGQGTDVLSLKQYQVVLGFKGYGVTIPRQQVTVFASLLDIAPTLLDLLEAPTLKKADGQSLAPYIRRAKAKSSSPRPFFIETADTIADMEVDKIFVEKVVKQMIGAYRVNVLNGQLVLNPQALPSIIKSKQRAVLWGDWMLARYPAQMRMKFSPVVEAEKTIFKLKPYLAPGYFVLLNRKTGEWTVGLGSGWAKKAPVGVMLKELKEFYGEELTATD